MERRSAILNFTLRIRAALLHELIQRIAERAYLLGYDDGKQGHTPTADKVKIDPTSLRKFQ